MKELGIVVKERLSAIGKTQGWLAEMLGVSDNAVSKWIKTGKISRDNALAAAKALGISVEQLLNPAENLVTLSAEENQGLKHAPQPGLQWVSQEEYELLTLFRGTDERGRKKVLSTARAAPQMVRTYSPALATND